MVRGDPAAMLLVLLLAFSLLKAWALAQSSEGLDYYQFWVVGRALARGEAGDVYSDESRVRLGRQFLLAAQGPHASPRQRMAAQERAVLQTYSTPLLYSALGALTSGSYESDYRVFQLLSLAAGVGAVALLARLLGYSWLATLAAAVVFSDWYEPFLSDVRVGNVNRLELGLLALFLWLRGGRQGRGRRVLGGAVLAFGVLFKPNLAFVVPLLAACWLLRRRREDFATAGAGLVLGMLLELAWSSASFRSGACWAGWMAGAARIPEDITPVSAGNFALARLVADAWGFHVSAGLGGGLAAATLVVLALGGRGQSEADEASGLLDDARMVALGGLIWLLSAPLVWAHYLLLAVPAAVLALRPTPGRRGAARLVAAAATVALMSNPLRAMGVVHGAAQMATASVLGLAALWLVLLNDVYHASTFRGGPMGALVDGAFVRDVA